MRTILIAFLLYKQIQTTQPLKPKISNLLALSGGQDSICLFLILIVWSFLSPVNRDFSNDFNLGGTGSAAGLLAGNTTFSSLLFQKVEQRLSPSKNLKLNKSHQLFKKLNKEPKDKYSLFKNQKFFNKKASEKVERVSFHKRFEKNHDFFQPVSIYQCCTCSTFLRKNDKFFVNRKTLTVAENKNFFLYFSDKLLARQIRFSFHKIDKQGFKKLPRKVYFASVWCNHLWQKDGFYTTRELIRLSFLWQTPFYVSIALFPNLTEQKARLWRYKNFGRLLNFYKFNQLITGHTGTDRAETLLLHLLRGSGTTGLISIPWEKSFSLPLSNSFSRKGFSYLLTKKSFNSI